MSEHQSGYHMKRRTAQGRIEYLEKALIERQANLAASRAEVERLRMLLSAAKKYGSHIIGLNVEAGDPFHAEVERLRGLLRQLLQHRGYVYVAQPTDYICSHCGGQWEMSDQERHNDNCPVPLAEAEVGVPSGTAAMRRSLLIDIGAIDQ